MEAENSAGLSAGPTKSDMPATINRVRLNPGLGAAIERAAHQILDHPKIFDDPLALRIIGAEAEAKLRSRLELFQSAAQRSIRAFMAIRSRYAEDELARSIERGVRQYVILGAGLDTFAYRNPFGESLRVFEVDHPASQASKLSYLEKAAISVPNSVTFVPVDFETEILADALGRSGFRSDEPTFFCWLGVVRYLSRETVMSVLGSIVSSARAGSEIVFSFSFYPSPPRRILRAAYRAIKKLAGKRSDFRATYFNPSSLANDLKRMGFADAEILGLKEMNALYCADRTDGLRVREGSGLLKARV
jgi:methyltransferase (TIGR00027 family)